MVTMHDALIEAVIDWPRQRAAFAHDGSLRDIYVFDTTLADWQCVLAHVIDREQARTLLRGGDVVPAAEMVSLLDRTAGVASLFEPSGRGTLLLHVGGCELACHFFVIEQIELSFDPREVTAGGLRELLAFMIELGEVTRRRVAMTPENGPEAPLFTYEAGELRWHA